ncbi:TonB-dependent receptor plug domain-containing protein [Rudaea sp.]|uniref:TonB-dependent receptor plug domain-containing protein n=1 Tax=Rudaea sp. TaxID=2136325 RepID=UPI002ED6828F
MIRRSQASFAVVASLLGISGAFAQTSPAASDDTAAKSVTPTAQLEQIEVLGSHIRGVDLETQHLVLVLDRADIERTGLTSISDVVQQIVDNGQTLNRHINNNGNGELTVNLRSLGANRTLVLLNGQRFATDLNGAVDLSAIPLALVERVEVLLDSASAIYGSDAIAGVINIITRRNFDGAELRAYYAQTDHDDGMRHSYDVSFGRKGDNWNASLGLEYDRDDPIFAGNRAISAVPVFGLPASVIGSSTTPYSWLAPCGRRSCLIRLIDGHAANSPDDFRPVDFTADLYNYAPINYLETPQQRRAVFAQTRYEFGPALALNVDALFNRRDSRQQLAQPTVIVSALDTGFPDAIAISADNVYNPLGETILSARRRFVEAGPRHLDERVDTRRYHMGLDGSFAFAGRDFTWRADAVQTKSAERDFAGPFADDRRLALALGPSFRDASGTARCGTPDAIIAGCVPLDLFGPPGSITPAMLDYVGAFEHYGYGSRSQQLEANLSTTRLFEMPAGDAGFAFGVEHRRESGYYNADPLDAGGYANGFGAGSTSTSGSYTVSEIYAEFDLPLLRELPFASKLDLIAGTRYSRYSNFGGTTNTQFGLRWKPVDAMLVRANYAQGFRAPDVNALFAGNIAYAVGAGYDDPCDTVNRDPPSTPAVLARCRALGAPSPLDTSAANSNGLYSGNPHLKPEISRARGVGIFYTPSWLEGFDLSLDWYDIRLRDAISDPGDQGVIYDCYLFNNDAACTQIHRDPADGTIAFVHDYPVNKPGGLETEGYDIMLAWKHDTPLGRINAKLNANYVDYFGEIGKPAPGTQLANGVIAAGNLVGINTQTASGFFGVIWRWRAQATLGWNKGPWSASITGRYFSHIDEDCSIVTFTAEFVGNPALDSLCSAPDQTIDVGNGQVPKNRVPSVTFTDIEFGWDAPWRAHVALGVRNAFARTPPVSYSAYANSFFPDYDVPGRFFYASYRQKF